MGYFFVASQTVHRRSSRRLSLDQFVSDLQASAALHGDLASFSEMSANDLNSLYDFVFAGLLDHHYLSVTVRHKVQPMPPLFDAECRPRVRAAERRYKQLYLATDTRA